MKTRFAPSPTGFLHIGSVRTALFSWLLARHFGGTFLLRIEDTDRQRSKPEYTDLIIQTLKWLGIDWDGEIEYQSLRLSRYEEVIQELVAKGDAYYCDCSVERLDALRAEQMANGCAQPHYDGHCRDRNLQKGPGCAVRLKMNPQMDLSFDDLIHGHQQRSAADYDDWIIQRSDGDPTYNFAVVVDDYDMDITHVMRGDDHLNNTPRQVALYHTMKWPMPVFGHIPMILDENGARLSKRSGSANILQYREQGFLPHAILNALVRLGWSHGDAEIFTLEEMISAFDGHGLQRSPACFNTEKFYWIGKHWMQHTTSLVEYALKEGWADSADDLQKGLILAQDRVKNFQELRDCTRFIQERVNFQSENRAIYSAEQIRHLEVMVQQAREQSIQDPAEFFAHLKNYAKSVQLGIKDFAFPLRHILTGEPQSFDLVKTMTVLGMNEVYERVDSALKNA